MNTVHVNNEIGQVGRVLVHRPGLETQRFPHGEFALAFPLRPASSDFNLSRAQAEHDALTEILKAEGAQVIELCDLLEESLANSPAAKNHLIACFLENSRIEGNELIEAATRYLAETDNDEQFCERLFGGIRYGDTSLAHQERFPLAQLTNSAFDPDTFLSSPLNTAFFTRDPMSVVGDGVSLNHMYWHDRNRETDILETVLACHPAFAKTPQWLHHGSSFHLEGGDIVNLSESALAIGFSSRTESLAIDQISQNLLWGEPPSSITDIYVFEVPQSGNRLHLDAYLSRVDYDTFVVDPALGDHPSVYHLRQGIKKNTVRIDACSGSITRILGRALGEESVRTVDFGSGSSLIDFEYGNGAAGVLALSPGNLCVCAENSVANEMLVNLGMTVHPVSIQEMTAGFGGPNSLCLPLEREDL